MTKEQMIERIKTLAPETKVEMTDLTGTQDHWQALIVSSVFEDKMVTEQHRLVYALFAAEIQSNEVHALTLKTFSPSQYKNFNPMGGI